MDKLIINRYTTKPPESLDDSIIVPLEPLEYEVDFEMYRQDYLYKGIEFTVEGCRYDLDNKRWIYTTKPVCVSRLSLS